ncbi:hypothetical protein ID866_2722 [Astraeus odoratus]|nr:hypothetical protein ID866_2722 [Astraeus odoratus]
MPSIPITIFTGFLGAGKTTIILSLLPKLPKDYRVVLLKNEFGDTQVNIFCRGSAFPATLSFQIRELERETNGDFTLDAIITVIDAENFTGYEDTSPTAKMQASYSDLILVNKWEYLNDRALDVVLDHLNTLNDLTPKVRCNGRNGVDPDLLFGIDSKLFKTEPDESIMQDHHDEVQTVTVFKGWSSAPSHAHVNNHVHGTTDRCCEGDKPSQLSPGDGPSCDQTIDERLLRTALEAVNKESVWRVKGFVRLEGGLHILNWAFGRYELTKADIPNMADTSIRLTVMGERGEVRRAIRKFCNEMQASII